MKNSSLAERVDAYDAAIESLKLSREPATRVVVPQGTSLAAPRPFRRAVRVGGIQTRDQGLRLFRVS
jgi:hypothetical protein